MAATRPWWHEIVAGLSTERIPADPGGGAPLRPPARQESSSEPRYGDHAALASRSSRLPGGVITRRNVEWDPGSPALEWVRRVTHDGRALAIRRAQDARRRQPLGITPRGVMRPAPRASLAIAAPGTSYPSWPRRSSASFSSRRPLAAPSPPALGGGGAGLHPQPLVRPDNARVMGHETAQPPGSPAAAPTYQTRRTEPVPLLPRPVRPPNDTNPPPCPPTVDTAPAGHVTIQRPHVTPPPTLPLVPPGSGDQAPTRRREGTSVAPPVMCTVPGAPPLAAASSRGKGSKYARLCAGPWAVAMEYRPALPPIGAKRARAGLAHVPMSSADIDRVKRERSACALAAILPWAAAGFVLGDSDAMVTARSVRETTVRLIRALSAYGVSSVDAAQSTLGRLVSWVATHHPGALVIEGSHVSDFLEHERPSSTTLTAMTWLRDHCGLAIPVRGAVCRPFRCRPPIVGRSKESLSLGAVVSLEYLAANHPSGWVRGQAAGWSLLARLALRVEQAQSCVINSFTRHELGGETFTIIVGAVQRDKHPDPSKRRPRPIWGVIDGLTAGRTECLRNSLHDMLEGVELSQFLIRDTDSPDGDPTRASSWVAAPLRGASRIDASLQALLRLPPASLSHEEAGRHHGHSAKRFLLNVAEASGAFSSVEACEVGRFSMSTAQSPDLEPVAAMLQAHSLRASILPDIYAGKAKVARVFDLLVKAHLVLRTAGARLAADPSLPGTGDASWGSAGPFAPERTAPRPLLLTLAQ